MQLRNACVSACLAMWLFGSIPVSSPAQPRDHQEAAVPSTSNVVACRLLEVHTGKEPPVTLVIFHQHDKQDQPRFAALLKRNSGGAVQVQTAGAPWQTAAVVRLKSCFGRGLLILPAGATAFKEGADFEVKFPEAGNAKLK
ncbi:MAG TPA: hypothetical protein VLY23_03585 [Candidatus Acidoferrum sp.]|nr:hypothetical protein [Candidatus Acidoferrum sp.]